MLRNRLGIVLGGCLLSASAAMADTVAYVDCSSHPEETQVFGKPRRTPDTVASLPCGERFTVLLYGFVFSRIQTKDGQIGYVYSNVISADRSGVVPPPTATRVSAATANPPVTATAVAQPKVAAAAPVQVPSAPAQPAPTPVRAPVATSTLPDAAVVAAAVAQANATTTAPTEAATAQAVVKEAPASASSAAEVPVPVPASTPTAPTQGQAAPIQVPPAEASVPTASVKEGPATAVQPESTPAAQPEPVPAQPEPAAAQPEPAPAEPAAPAIRSERVRESWERPNAGGIRRMPLIELFGGYSFARFDNGGGSGTNLNGVLGSFGWNVKPWLQLVADSSYNVVNVSGTKNVLYGNHWGPRVFRRVRNRWAATPFIEALVGGTRADTTVSGAGGYSTSINCISYKVGGGIDIKPSRHLEIRLFDVDYYRTTIGTGLHQNNYWASAGIVVRLFGGSE